MNRRSPDDRRLLHRTLLSLSLTFVILVSLVAGAALAAPPRSPGGTQAVIPPVQQSGSVQAAIDPRVLEDTANGQNGHFLVLLKQQAHPRELAGAASDRASQGTLVVDALRSVAAASQAPVAAQLDALGARYRVYWVANFLAVEGNRAVVEAMAARPDVQAIESDRAFTVTLEPPEPAEEVSAAAVTSAGWNLTLINAPAVWALGDNGQNTVYANADTGVQWTHPALKPHYRGWDGTAADHNYSWWDAIHADIDGNGNSCGFSLSAPCDDNGHGTHTMGTGVGDDGAGNQIGVAPGAKWIACRNMDAGVGRPSTYIECMQFFLAPTDLNGNNPDPSKRPDVVGNSYGCPSSELCTATSLLTAMDNLRAAGIFMSVSAGNSGSGCSTVTDPPAFYDSAVTVGATGYNSNSIASYSSRGPVTADGSGRTKPDLVAPGSSVRSSYPTNTYTTMSGTSMASPHVAGAVALLWSAFPTLRGNVDHTEFILEQTALHLTTTQGCGGDSSTRVPNNVYGYGRIDVLAAYNYAAAEVPVTPAAPTGLAAAAVSSSQIDLTWADNANNETGFKIERSPDGVTWAQIATAAANATTYSDLGLAASTSYSYRVRAYNATGDSDYSNTASAETPAPPTPPAAPTGLTASAVSSSQINLTWNDSDTETGFKIERCTGAGCSNFAQIATVGANVTSYSNTGLTASTSYSYRVRAYNAAGDSGYSNTASAVTQAAPALPAAPSNLTAAAVSRSQINLAWTDNATNEIGFKIERCKGSTCTNFTQIATVGANVTGYSNTGLSANTTYRYRVRTYNTSGNSGYSNIVTATTPRR